MKNWTVQSVAISRRSLGAIVKPNSITLAGSELAPYRFGAGSELVRSWFDPDSVMEFGLYGTTSHPPADPDVSSGIVKGRIGVQQITVSVHH